MTLFAPLPPETRAHLCQNTHPGLLLDKYVESWDKDSPPGKLSEQVQKPALNAVARLSQSPPPELDWSELQARRERVLCALQAQTFSCVTFGPMTLHLARASALENAGICLHPLYGFVYLPGSGLKGMARAYAETVVGATEEQVKAVFGTTDATGAVVFHDAWPIVWPRLAVDILNNHHAEYYQKCEPPGDWENPIPVYFLIVREPANFKFALCKRHGEVPACLVDQAKDWLVGALCHLGAGAKTNSGYGAFRLIEAPSPRLLSPRYASLESTVELATPGFLAGADHKQQETCQLRPATVRGVLRWWWRTMHAAHVDPSMLACLEAAVWGDTARGGAVRLTVEPISATAPLLYDKQWLSDKNALPRPADNKTTQGLWYHSFGMDDKRKEDGRVSRHQRYYILPGAQWRLKLAARASSFENRNRQGKTVCSVALADPQVLLEQAQCALWLLCNFGGVGSKSRKGFGSLAVPKELADWSLERCKQIAAAFRQHCQVPRGVSGGSPALEEMLTVPDIPTPWTNYWYALDQLAAIAQQFAQERKHNVEKRALGMPRNLRPPLRGSFQPGPHVQKTGRHASPAMYHLAPGSSGLIVRVVAFPSPELPDDPTRQKSRRFLQLLMDHLRHQLPAHIERQGKQGRTPPQNPTPRSGDQKSSDAAAPEQATATRYPKPGETVQATLVKDPKGKGRRFAELKALNAIGPIINASDVPEGTKPGDKVTLLVHSITPAGDGSIRAIQFKYPTEALLKQLEKSKGKGQGRSPGQGRGRR